MTPFLRIFAILLLCQVASYGQTALGGKVTDESNGDPLFLANIALYRNDLFITGTQTDENGNFYISNLDGGSYDVEATYSGFNTKRVKAVQVFSGKVQKLDFKLESGVMLDGITVVEYKVPLIQQDNTTSGGIITSEQIKKIPVRNVIALGALSAGVATADQGSAPTIRGSRSNATDYIIDGIRVRGSLIPETFIEQLEVITGGMEAKYGDATGGLYSITTKGPSKFFAGTVEVETSKYLDAFSNSLVGFSLSGPLLKSKKTGDPIIGFLIGGRYNDRLDDDQPATSVFRVKPDKLAELEANPILNISNSLFVAADFLTNEDVDALNYRPFERSTSLNLTGKVDFRFSKAIDLSVSGAYDNGMNQFTPGGWAVYNSHNNPMAESENWRTNIRLRHRLGDPNKNSGVIRNASYTLQAGIEQSTGSNYDSRHSDRLFDYGYVGKFDIEWVPSFNPVLDPQLLQFYLVNTDNRQVLRSYQPGTINPVLANYNKALDINSNEQLNGSVTNFLLSGQGAEALVNRTSFIAPNGAISSVFTNSWNIHTNVGPVFNQYSRSSNDLLVLNANAGFDIVPGGSEKGRHSIQFGFVHEQRADRAFVVNPRGLWDVARLQANNHISGIPFDIPELLDTVGFLDVPNFPGTPLLRVVTKQDIRDYLISKGLLSPEAENELADNLFFQRIRERTGQSLNEYVNIDGLDPNQLSLDLFSAKELNDAGLTAYIGNTYLGDRFDGTFTDFFTATDANGVRTFPVAPNRPIYSAAYLQDRFTFRDIIFRLGVRVDRYDANTKVLKDPYSLYEIMGAKDYHDQFGGQKPGSVGDDYKVYLDDIGSSVLAYRRGDDFFAANGTPINNPASFFPGGLVFPKYADPNVERIPNYIKSRSFNPDASFRDYIAQINVMPRLAFSFPISDKANFFAHYDILVQRPPSNTLATARDYFYFTDDRSIKNNPNLLPEKTIDYEVGFQQELSKVSAIKVSAYYKELRNMLQQRTIFPVPLVIQYTTYDNIDFGTVKGFSFQYDLRRTGNVSLLANYNLQFADGTGSNSNSRGGLTNQGILRTLYPLDYDERHRVNLNLDYRFDREGYNGPVLFNTKILADAGANLVATAVSGRPYTAKLTPLEFGGDGTVGAINGARKPWYFNLDLRVDKTFRLTKGSNVNVFFRANNILNRKNPQAVYPATGSPYDDGFLLSNRGQQQINTVNADQIRELQAYLDSYQWALVNPGLFSLPRRMFVGLTFDFLK